MKVICIANSGERLSPKHFGVGYSTSSIFHLALENEYVVYGMALWRGLLSYLIIADSQRPAWYPSELFKVTDSKLPVAWHFAFFSQDDERWLNAVWGYEELTNSKHYDQLTELDPQALKIFEANRKQIEEAD